MRARVRERVRERGTLSLSLGEDNTVCGKHVLVSGRTERGGVLYVHQEDMAF